MDFLKSLCSVPTAPFAENHVADFVRKFVKSHKNLSLSEDRFGNLLIELKSRSRLPRWVFTAHMDHPGFVAGKMIDGKKLTAAFRGWVKVEFVRGSRVRFFDDRGEAVGRVIEANAEDYDQRAVPKEVVVRVNRPVAPGSPGMFDQGAGRYSGGKFVCRVCDDLAGAAACLEMMDQVSRHAPKSPVAVLFTRAEEEGFIGCIATCEHKTLLRRSDRVIAIECSSEQQAAPRGNGVIIRVGDRASVFNSALTYFLGQQAEQLKKADRSFKYQRALMPGGVCEATVYDIYGYTAASLCVALGNYHNMDVKRVKIGPEYIDSADWRNMVKLFVRLAEHGHEFKPGHGELRKRVLQRFSKLKHLLTQDRIHTRPTGGNG
ncbi:MAG TPA: M20/M25/M40 family metallo-hydrolase [Tepidisphaeraceae bacterium]|jgi:putative aminopeptidase FrvX